MASWQRYPGVWMAEGGAVAGQPALNTASAPLFQVEQEEEKKDVQFESDGRSQHPPTQVHSGNSIYYGNWPPNRQEQAQQAQRFPGYPAVPPQRYAGYSYDVQEPREHYESNQWRYPNSTARQSPEDQWAMNQQRREGPESRQLHETHRHWSRRGSPSWRNRTPSFVMSTLKLCLYHVLNVIFALVACGILSAGICTAASLIPVCCVGLLIFQVLVYIVFSMAQWDIKLGNYITPPQQAAYPNLLPHGRFIGREGFSGCRISPGLAMFSPLSLMAMLYFVLVKPVIGALSFLSVLLVVAPTVSFITSLTSEYQGEYYDSIQIYGVNSASMRQYPGLSLVGAICVTLLGVALMQLVAKISLAATRFFCCEKFAVTTRFAPYQYQTLSTNGVTSYGSTVTRS
ncbi:hypothetical protein P3T76_009214 [Phytophthora citrophthora]|uniref:Uncharacterized protein n=1 Tax=Phytophthora citrophthora TaxID=4793 RepID=A0AAD9LJX1_9STRA|nr:hypothetical protein P3T76_009214 [Phytophthora citrophthora]